MAIRPLSIDAAGTVSVVHDEEGHTGTLKLADLQPGRRLDGTPDYRFTTLPCPVPGCGAVSLHPVSGGCDPEAVQRLFVRLFVANPKLAKAKDWASGKALVKQLCAEMDGLERWRLEGASENDE